MKNIFILVLIFLFSFPVFANEEDVYYEVISYSGATILDRYFIQYKNIDKGENNSFKIFFEGKWISLGWTVLIRRLNKYQGPEKRVIENKENSLFRY